MGTTTPLQYLTTQLGGPVPLAYGRVRAQGNNAILYEHPTTKNRTAFYLLGEGEWDGIDRLWINSKMVDPTDTTLVHFHPGVDGTLGAGLAPTSTGGDQKADAFWTNLPGAGAAGGLQPLGFSRRAYIAVSVPVDANAPTPQLTVLGDYRTTKVRQFDANGNQTGYAFSTNPAWIILDALFRFVLKREAVVNSAITAQEKTRINWASFYNASQYYPVDISGGAGISRYEINVAFAQQLTVTALFEQLLLMSRSYLVEQAGQIYLFPDQPRVSTFILTSDHYVPGTLQYNKKAVRASANHFVGTFNDLLPPVVANVIVNGAVRSSGTVTITTQASHPFMVGDYVNYSNCDDPSFDGTFFVTDVLSSTSLSWSQAGPNTVSGRGILGTNESLYAKRSTIDDHEQHQLAIGQRGAGLSVMAKQIELDLDYGNNTSERVRRLLWYQKVRSLGVDAAPYKAPFQILLKARAESVDQNGNALIAQLRGDLITLDHSVSEELADTVWEIIEMDFTPPAGNSGDPNSQSVQTAEKSRYVASSMYNEMEAGLVDLLLLQYQPLAFTDSLGASFALVGLTGLPTSGGLKDNNGPAFAAYQVFVLASVVEATDAGSSCTISHPGIGIKVPGLPGNPTTASGLRVYGTSQVTGCAYSTHYFLFLVDPDLRGDNHGATITLQVTTDKETAFSTPGHIYIDELTTPAPGGANTFGLNLGHNPW